MTLERELSLIDAMSEHGSTVRDAGYEMHDLANCAAMLGQDRLARRLVAIAANLDTTYIALNRAHGVAVHGRLTDAEQSTRNMMSAVFAGIELANAEPTP